MAFTYFFRDLQTLENARDLTVPALRSRRYANIWDAGCAMGPEPYTVAILLHESIGKMAYRNVRIFATDIDNSNLFGKVIHDGIYPAEQLQRIPSHLFTYFNKINDTSYQINDDIRNSITFAKHDLLSLKPIRTDFSLIICKNVLLHFSEGERSDVIQMFHNSLEDGGYLVMEKTQKLPDNVSDLFEPAVQYNQIFRKK